MDYEAAQMNYYTLLFYKSMNIQSVAMFWKIRTTDILADKNTNYQQKIDALETALRDFYTKNNIEYPEQFDAVRTANNVMLERTDWHTLALELMKKVS